MRITGLHTSQGSLLPLGSQIAQIAQNAQILTFSPSQLALRVRVTARDLFLVWVKTV